MWDVRLVQVLAGQEDLVAWWQLHNLGWAPPVINGWVRRHGWRTIHNGVYAVFRGPLTERQRWIAAILTAPGTYLCAHSVANAYGFHLSQLGYETVVRPGSGGPRMYPGLRVTRSTRLEGHTSLVDHIPAVTAELALVQLAGDLDRGRLGRAFRESHRLRHSSADSLAKVLCGQRGTRYLAHLCDRYATIPYHRCCSDAESRGLEILHDAGIEPPAVNVQVNGPRPDFTWRRHKLIIEVDGAQFHEFAEEDAAKAAKWKAVGYRVKRISSDDIYARPEQLVALYHANVPNLA